MCNKDGFSGRVLTAAVKVKDIIDQQFELVTNTQVMPGLKDSLDINLPKWKSAFIFAKELKVRRTDLQGAFKYYNDKGIKEYQMERKIEAACILLANGVLTKKEIAIELEFDQEYFSSIFKKKKGMTPTEWQKKELERKNVPNQRELS